MLHYCHTGDLKNTRRYLQTYIHTFYLYFKIEVQCPRVAMLIYNHGQKSWDTCISGAFPIHTGPTPSLTPQTMLDARMQNFFRVSTLYGVGGGRTARKSRTGCTALRRNREMTEKYEYYSTVPKTFVQDCMNPSFGKKVCLFIFPTLVRHFGTFS